MKTGLALLLIGTLQAPAQILAADLEASLARSITNKNYRTPLQAEFNRAQELFEHTLQGDRPPAELKTRWAELGFGFCELTTNGETLWLVSEPEGKEFGRGWYLFRTNRASAMALEAPHALNDIHTGVIALRLFLSGRTRVFAASTITRHRADMAHLDDTFFHAFTVAFAAACPTGLVVQLHGFESDNHSNAKAEVIASAGTRTPGPWFGELIQRLRQATSWIVLAYPQDIQQLGGTTNSQGQSLNRGTCRFLHLEITKEQRDRLTRDKELRRALLDSLAPAPKQ